MPRPKGLPKTGGRKNGSKNKRTVEIEKAAGGILPLDYMLQVMRDPEAEKHRRDAMSVAAAPYLHARRAPEDKGGNTPVTYILTTNVDPDA